MIRLPHAARGFDPIQPMSHRVVPLAALRSKGALRLLDVWCSSRIDHLVPCTGLLPFSRVPDIVDSLCQLEVDPLSQRLRFRFAGAELARWLGSDPAGEFLDQIVPAPDRAEYDQDCRLAMSELRPIAAVVQGVAGAGGGSILLERLILPLTHGLRRSDSVVCGLFDLTGSAVGRRDVGQGAPAIGKPDVAGPGRA